MNNCLDVAVLIEVVYLANCQLPEVYEFTRQ